jgi:ubiquinone biosynthesis protein
MFFEKTISNISRIGELVNVLLSYGFEEIVTTTSLKRLVPSSTKISWQRNQRPVFEYSHWERIRMVLEELGPTYIKLAQVISNRADILPEPLIRELEKLQSEVPPFPFEEVKRIVETELGGPLEEFFEYFDERTLGSASIGQVHRARTTSGEEVVVKVQRPDARKKIQTDLALIKEFVRLTETYFIRNGILNPLDVVETFEKTMNKELDYNNEARNVEQFRKFYRRTSDFYIPKSYRHLSTEKILVQEYIRGCKITDTETIMSWGLQPKKIAEKGMDIYLRQIFENGYFHADPHPGNVIIQKDGAIGLVDFGMVGKLMEKDRMAFAGVFISMARKDAKAMAFHFRTLSIDSEIEDMRRFEYDLNELIEEFGSLDVSEMQMADLAAALQRVIYDYSLKVPGGVFLILRALVILEGIGKSIYPDFNTFEFVKPYGKKILAEQYSFSNITKELLENAFQVLTYLGGIPSDIKLLFRKIKKGKLVIQVENFGYDGLEHSIDRAGYRIGLALIIFGLIVSSSIIMLSDIGQKQFTSFGIPVISLVGYLLSVLLFLHFSFKRKKSSRRPSDRK